MHLVIPTHVCLFWVVCHSSRTFPPKEFERESQNRHPPSPHRQITPFLTFDPWPTVPILAGTGWWNLSLMRASLLCESIAYLAFTRLLLPMGFSGIAVCSAICLTFCGVVELLGLYSSHFVSSLGWVLLGCGPLWVN